VFIDVLKAGGRRRKMQAGDAIHRTRVQAFIIDSVVLIGGFLITICCPKGKAAWVAASVLYGHLLGKWWVLKGDRQENQHRGNHNHQLLTLDARVAALEKNKNA
jgi:hypothetical protein